MSYFLDLDFFVIVKKCNEIEVILSRKRKYCKKKFHNFWKK